MFSGLSIPAILVGMMALLFSLAFHGFIQALSARLLGDDTAKNNGFLTINPIPHFDILGSLVFPLIGIALGGSFFGWGKMVPVQPHLMTRKLRMKVSAALFCGSGLIAFAVLALLGTIALAIAARHFAPGVEQRVGLFQGGFMGPDSPAFQALSPNQILLLSASGAIIRINVVLAVFHLLPVGSLDGAGLLRGFLPDHLLPKYDRYRFHPYAWVLVLVLGLTGLLSFVLGPLTALAYSILLPVAQIILGA